MGVHFLPSGFPYSDAGFAFVCLISVFTHILSDAVQNYVRETGRVLKPGAILLSAFCYSTMNRAG
jgi:hypothetical protein